jgi:hypothetical protein
VKPSLVDRLEALRFAHAGVLHIAYSSDDLFHMSAIDSDHEGDLYWYFSPLASIRCLASFKAHV